MTPLFTIGMGVVFMHDPFGPRMALGTIVALAGVLIVALRFNQLLSLALALRPRAQ
jgi:drug/metabolite transporter (DMT)-like permease